MSGSPVVIVGAGPAGLAAAQDLARRGMQPLVLEKSDQVGGIARTETYKGYHFDIGGHRFFTKIERVNRLWQEMLGSDFLKVRRMSRIYYKGLLFNYPLNMFNALSNLGIAESALMISSYLGARIRPYPREDTFEEWVSNRFGRRLFETFFRSYTEKVWGIPCSRIQADWAAQRIKGLSLLTAVSNALLGTKNAKSLIDEFYYPRLGPGMMWQRFQEAIAASGGTVRLQTGIVALRHRGGRVSNVAAAENGRITEVPADHVISSMPITRLVSLLDPPAPDEVLRAAESLSYRDFVLVGLVVDRETLFPDQWIYIHNPAVRVGRIQNLKNWSAAMVPDTHTTSLGMEYFCNEGDAVWNTSDDDLIALAAGELGELGLAPVEAVSDGHVWRQPGAYPVYDGDYHRHLGVIRNYLAGFTNLQSIGRNGMHRYNNMDQAMLVGMLAAENACGARHDLWEINEEKEYLEEYGREAAAPGLSEEVLISAFARMDKLAFASALGCVSGLLIFLTTIWLVIKGGSDVGPNLILLNQYFPGYTVTAGGALLAAGYGFATGFLFGWLFAYLRNFLLAVHVYRARRKAELMSLKHFFDSL